MAAEPKTGRDKPGDQHDIFDGLPALVAVRIDALLAALGLGRHVADEVLQRAHGADPAAEEAAEKQRGKQNDEAPEQPAIEGMASEGIHNATSGSHSKKSRTGPRI